MSLDPNRHCVGTLGQDILQGDRHSEGLVGLLWHPATIAPSTFNAIPL